jgi:hypothetical protein
MNTAQRLLERGFDEVGFRLLNDGWARYQDEAGPRSRSPLSP